MGLIQRAIEMKGIPTVSITVAKDVTEILKVPRAIFVPWPMGHHFGAPFLPTLQRRVVIEMLQLLQTAETSGTIVTLPIKWAEVRRQSKLLTEQGMRL